MTAIERDVLLRSLPPEPDTRLALAEIRHSVGESRKRVVVFDDDPTGVQTVRDIDVLTTWDVADLESALVQPEPLFYVLSNSRALDREGSVSLAADMAWNLAAATAHRGIGVDIVSRSDSTLRGHYPWELDPLLPLFGAGGPDGHLLVPAFPEGGRITVDGVHYVAEGTTFVPAGETDSARDPSFSYHSSFLPDWVEEKSEGRWRSTDVLLVPLALLRSGDLEQVAMRLRQATRNQPIVADAVTYADLTLLVAGLLRAERRGSHILCRTAASYVRARLGLGEYPLLTRSDLGLAESSAGGLVFVGSYVRRTSEQLDRARAGAQVVSREVSVPALLEASEGGSYVKTLVEWADGVLATGRTALVYTSRDLISAYGARTHVQIAAVVSAALVAIANKIANRPAWVIAKGGITSSDIATKGFGARKLRVLGQVATGVPVERLGPESRFPGLSYVVFPGNVGEPDTLARLIAALSGQPE